MEDKQLLEWINVFKVNRKIKSRLWPWIKIILSIVLFFVVFYGDIYVHILDGTNLGRIVEAMILVVFSSGLSDLLYFRSRNGLLERPAVCGGERER